MCLSWTYESGAVPRYFDTRSNDGEVDSWMTCFQISAGHEDARRAFEVASGAKIKFGASGDGPAQSRLRVLDDF